MLLLLICNVILVQKIVFLETESYCFFLPIFADIVNSTRLKILKKRKKGIKLLIII